MSHPEASILLSTYNGEGFLTCQIESILAQDFRDFRLLVRDDGSTDGTVALIRDFARRDGRVVFLNDPATEPPRNLGYRGSFLTLLEAAGDGFFAFCDQDDFWFPEKLRLGVEALRAADPARPAMYTSSYRFCDADLRETGVPFTDTSAPPFGRTLFYNAAFGFTIAGNGALRRVVLDFAPSCPSIPHDKLCAQLALLYGDYIADPRQTALYRRHGGAVTVSTARLARLAATWLRNDILGGNIGEYRAQARQLLAALEARPDAPRGALETLRLYASRSPVARMRGILSMRRLRPTIGGELALRLALALGR